MGTLVLLGVVEGVLAGGVSRALGALVAGEEGILWLGLLFPLDFGKGVVGRLGTPPLGMPGIPPIWFGPGPIWLGPGPIWLGPGPIMGMFPGGMFPGRIPGLMPCLKGGLPMFWPMGPILGI